MLSDPEIVMSAVLKPKVSLQEYLDWENDQPERHELVLGEIEGPTDLHRIHGCVTRNLIGQLSAHLDGSDCQVFAHSMKVQVSDNTVLYPDVFVTCDRGDLSTDQIFRAPKLVIEVLSPSTQAYDRSKKFALYRQLASLQEYLLIDPDTQRLESFARSPRGEWVLHDISDDAEMVVASIGCTVSMSDVFAGIEPAVAR